MKKQAIILTMLAFSSQAFAADVNETAAKTIQSFEKIFGVTKGKRRNHTKGFCFVAKLIPADKAINEYTNSPLFSAESSVIGRFSHKGGNNLSADNKPTEYGMGLSIYTASGPHNMAVNTLDFFPVATPEAFAELMHAKTQGKEAVKAFKSKNVDLQRFKAHMSKKNKTLTPYEGNTYNSVNSFYLVNSSNKKTAIRWSFIPTQQQTIVVEPKQDFFFENMQANLKDKEIIWDMVVTIANAEDQINNATLPWLGEHKQITAAKLKISSISTEQQGNCDAINFDPLVLSSGFEPSADPLLQVRRSSYAISFGKRMVEQQQEKTQP